MGAKKVLLTHFSARYPKIPLGVSEYANKELAHGLEVGVAFDHLHMSLGQFWKMRHYLPALETLFKDDPLSASVMGDEVEAYALHSDGRTSPEKTAQRATG
jgi:ribonuclease Z